MDVKNNEPVIAVTPKYIKRRLTDLIWLNGCLAILAGIVAISTMNSWLVVFPAVFLFIALKDAHGYWEEKDSIVQWLKSLPPAS